MENKIVLLALTLIFVLLVASPCFANDTDSDSKVKVDLQTNYGLIVISLDYEAAPKTVENFINYVKSNFYEGTIFHRVIPGFMIQCGGMTEDMKEKSNLNPSIENEASNGLKNMLGTIAMARTSDPHSASSQFFINVVDNAFLNHQSKTSQGWGYCVFGKVEKGMDVVDTIAKLPTTSFGHHQDVPVNPIKIEKVVLTDNR